MKDKQKRGRTGKKNELEWEKERKGNIEKGEGKKNKK